jgi:hypothetical protein
LTQTYVDRLRMATARRSGCDWCTVTGKSRESQVALWCLGEQLLSACQHEGEQPTRWHAHGYDGWAGDGVAVGKRGDGVHLRLSGQKAAQEWNHAVVASENCTRFDTALDLHFDTPVFHLARESYRKCGLHRPSNGRPPSRRLIVSGDGGSTFYTGSRSSEKMGRLYDKGVESRTHSPGKWWRWEVEFKGDSAVAASSRASGRPTPDEWMDGVTARFFRARGAVAPPACEGEEIYNLPPKISNDDRLLSWLAVGVRPTVARLIERLGSERVTFSLGLPSNSAVQGRVPTTATN